MVLNESDLALLNRCRSHTVDNTNAFASWVRRDVRAFLPHEFFVAAYGRVVDSAFRVDMLVPVGCPPQLADTFERRLLLRPHRALDQWVEHREPLLIDAPRAQTLLSRDERDEIDAFDLYGMVAHGFVEPDSGIATYFTFARVKGPLYGLHERKAWLLAATMHTNLSNIAQRMLTETLPDVQSVVRMPSRRFNTLRS